MIGEVSPVNNRCRTRPDGKANSIAPIVLKRDHSACLVDIEITNNWSSVAEQVKSNPVRIDDGQVGEQGIAPIDGHAVNRVLNGQVMDH